MYYQCREHINAVLCMSSSSGSPHKVCHFQPYFTSQCLLSEGVYCIRTAPYILSCELTFGDAYGEGATAIGTHGELRLLQYASVVGRRSDYDVNASGGGVNTLVAVHRGNKYTHTK